MFSFAISVVFVFTSVSIFDFTDAQYYRDNTIQDSRSINYPDAKDWFNQERLLVLSDPYDNSQVDSGDDSNVGKIRTKRSYLSTYPSKYNAQNSVAYGKQNYLVKNCRSISRTANDEWCTDNCRQSYCPRSFCICYPGFGTVGNQFESGSYNRPVHNGYVSSSHVGGNFNYQNQYQSKYGSLGATKTQYNHNSLSSGFAHHKTGLSGPSFIQQQKIDY